MNNIKIMFFEAPEGHLGLELPVHSDQDMCFACTVSGCRYASEVLIKRDQDYLEASASVLDDPPRCPDHAEHMVLLS